MIPSLSEAQFCSFHSALSLKYPNKKVVCHHAEIEHMETVTVKNVFIEVCK